MSETKCRKVWDYIDMNRGYYNNFSNGEIEVINKRSPDTSVVKVGTVNMIMQGQAFNCNDCDHDFTLITFGLEANGMVRNNPDIAVVVT